MKLSLAIIDCVYWFQLQVGVFYYFQASRASSTPPANMPINPRVYDVVNESKKMKKFLLHFPFSRFILTISYTQNLPSLLPAFGWSGIRAIVHLSPGQSRMVKLGTMRMTLPAEASLYREKSGTYPIQPKYDRGLSR